MRLLRYLFLLLCAFVAVSCSQKDTAWTPYEGPYDTAVLVYMAAENSLGRVGYDTEDINDMVSYIKLNGLGKNKVIIYLDPYSGGDPTLYSIEETSSGSAELKTLKTYDADQNSASAETMSEVLSDFFENAEAEIYSMILWSHGTGWMPATVTRSMLEDSDNQWMEISEFSSVLPDNVFDLILFDACLMGSIEVAYELKDKCNYMMASPAEVLADGMPYEYILEDLFNRDYEAACFTFYDYYQSNSYSYARLAAIGLSDMSKIDALTTSFKNIIAQYGDDISSLSISSIQRYRQSEDYASFDFLHFVQNLIPDENDPLRIDFEEKFDEFMVVHYNTDMAYDSSSTWGSYYYLKNCCGMSSYIPVYTSLNTYFQLTSWYQATYAQ